MGIYSTEHRKDATYTAAGNRVTGHNIANVNTPGYSTGRFNAKGPDSYVGR
jgi:flagellar hook-associated protein FlgK